jgi:UDP-N-acetylglucosamine 2-epimerase
MAILEAIRHFSEVRLPEAVTIYGDGKTSRQIIEIIKNLHDD